MKYIALRDVCEINMGQSPDSSSYNEEGRGIPFFQGNADFGERNPVTRVWCDAPSKIAKANDILISVRAPIGAVNYATETCCIGRGLAAITPDLKRVSSEYVFWLLKGKNAELNSKGTGSTFKAINRKALEEIQVPDVSLEEQAAHAANLEAAYKIIQMRKQQLFTLDDLIKARFVEMFIGRDYPLISVGNLSLGKGEYGAQSASVKYDSNRPRYVRITDINDDGTLNDDVVSSSNVEDDKQYKLCYGDFLFARMGATVGKTYAYKEGNQIYAGYLIRYKLNLEQILPEYLFAFTKLNQYWSWVKLNQSGAAQPGINAKKYDSLQIPVAPMREQKAFQSFAAQIDKSKSVIQKSLDETQLLFDSLMQKYFGGEKYIFTTTTC